MCPHCRTNAPLVYRGLAAYCAGCGRPRTPLAGTSLTHAGKPARFAGSALRVLGWVALFAGLGISALLGLLASVLAGGTAGAIVGGVFALLALLFFALTRRGGRALHTSADATRDRRREQALLALAANRGGVVQAHEAARVLDMSVDDADQFLTRLAQTQLYDMDVDIGEQGEVLYVFKQSARARFQAPRAHVRVDAPGRAPLDADRASARDEADVAAAREAAEVARRQRTRRR